MLNVCKQIYPVSSHGLIPVLTVPPCQLKRYTGERLQVDGKKKMIVSGLLCCYVVMLLCEDDHISKSLVQSSKDAHRCLTVKGKQKYIIRIVAKLGIFVHVYSFNELYLTQ